MSARFVTLEDDGLTVRVSPRGGAVVDAWYRARPLLRPYTADAAAPFDVLNASCFPFVPFAGRVEGNAFELDGRRLELAPNTTLNRHVLHGDGWLASWSVAERSRADVTLTFARPTDASSPYTYESRLTVAVVGGVLSLALSVAHRGAEPLPYGLGFHPFFPLTERTTIRFRAERCWSEREDHLPGTLTAIPEALDFATPKAVPAGPVHVGFERWERWASIVVPEHVLRIELRAGAGCDRLQLFGPGHDAADVDAARHVCLEPMTHTCNAHAMVGDFGLRRLDRGETMAVSMVIEPTLSRE